MQKPVYMPMEFILNLKKKRYMSSSFLKKSVIKLLDRTVYKTIILTVDFSVSDLTRSTQTVVFENMILSRISGPNRTEITGRWRKPHIDKFYNLDFSPKLTLRLLMSYIYGAPILDVSRSHTTTQHSQ